MISDRYVSAHPPPLSYTQSKLCKTLLGALEKCSCLPTETCKIYSETKKEEFVGEVS